MLLFFPFFVFLCNSAIRAPSDKSASAESKTDAKANANAKDGATEGSSDRDSATSDAVAAPFDQAAFDAQLVALADAGPAVLIGGTLCSRGLWS